MTRHPERAAADRDLLDALFEDVLVGHVGVVRDGAPVVVPTAIARDGDHVLMHGSTGSAWMRAAADGALVCLAVTALDAMVVSRSAFESSMRYRSAVLFGRCQVLTGDAILSALDVITDRLIPGRVAEVRRPTAKELAATLVLALPISEWSLKTSTGWPDDPDDDVAGDTWAGVVPALSGWGHPEPAPDLRAGIPVPPSVRQLAGESDAGE